MLNILSRINLNVDESLRAISKSVLKKFRLLTLNTSSEDHHICGNITITKSDRLSSCPGFCYLGHKYLYSNGRLMILDNRGAACVTGNILANDIEIIVEHDFAPDEFVSLIEEIIFCMLIQHGVLPVHSAAMRFHGKGFLFPGWGGCGKTGMLLHASNAADTIISDEWNFVAGNTIYPFLDKMSLMYYDILAFPELTSSVEFFRAQLYKTLRNVQPVLILKVLEKLKITLGCKKVKLSALCKTPLSSFPLDLIYFISKADIPETRIMDCLPGEIIDLMTANFFREKPSLFQLLNINSIAMQDRMNAVSFITEKYRDVVRLILHDRGKKVLLSSKNPFGLFKNEFIF